MCGSLDSTRGLSLGSLQKLDVNTEIDRGFRKHSQRLLQTKTSPEGCVCIFGYVYFLEGLSCSLTLSLILIALRKLFNT